MGNQRVVMPALAPSNLRRHQLHALARSGRVRTLLVDLHVAGAHEEPLHRVGCNAKGVPVARASAGNRRSRPSPTRSVHGGGQPPPQVQATCTRPNPPPLTIRRDAVKDVLEAAGDDAAEVRWVRVPLHRVGLATARLPVRKDGAVEALEDAVCSARAKAWGGLANAKRQAGAWAPSRSAAAHSEQAQRM